MYGILKTTMEIPEKLSCNQFICVLEGQMHPWKGYVAIDSIINGKSSGGVMMMPDVTPHELTHLARTMTLKYGFLGIPRGGAKAGIIADPENNPTTKREILQEFGEKLAPLVQKSIYEPGSDMGVDLDALRVIRKSAGFRVSRRLNPIAHAQSGYYTSFSVLAAAQAAVEKLGLNFSRCTAALEGFGNVGGPLAMSYAERGVKVLAISTIQGAVYDPKGLNIARLLKLNREFGSSMVNHVEGERIGRDELLSLNVDIFSPCARAWSITLQNVDHIQAKIIAPGANCAVTTDAEIVLLKRGILSIPHFVASCGGALGSTMEFLGCTEVQISDFIQSEVKRKITNVIYKAEKEKILPLELAERESLQKFNRMQVMSRRGMKMVKIRIGMGAYKAGLLPGRFIRRFLPGYFKKMLWSDSIFIGDYR